MLQYNADGLMKNLYGQNLSMKQSFLIIHLASNYCNNNPECTPLWDPPTGTKMKILKKFFKICNQHQNGLPTIYNVIDVMLEICYIMIIWVGLQYCVNYIKNNWCSVVVMCIILHCCIMLQSLPTVISSHMSLMFC